MTPVKWLLFEHFLVIFFVIHVAWARGEEETVEAGDVASPEIIEHATQPWTGDFDGMVKRGMIRVLVPYSKTFYFVDKGKQQGATYEFVKAFENYINKKLKKKTLKVRVVFIPVRRDQLLPGLLKGRGDIGTANLTITPEREKLVDFSTPVASDVKELVVTGPGAPSLKNIEDLAGQEIYVRESSSYYESLSRLNESFQKAGKPEMILTPADENLEDEDILEMVNAGLVPITVVDNHKADFWAQIFDHITVHQDLAVHSGGKIAWAFRKNSPELRTMVDPFIKKNRKGTLLGNILIKRYLKNTDYIRNNLSKKDIERFQQTIGFLKKYADQYEFDWLMVGAQAYQESELDQSKRSPAGAIGVMQLLPSTAADPNVNIPHIEKLENNIHAGVKYMRFMMDRYFKDDPLDTLDKNLFAFASYNAGPARIAQLRKKAVRMGLDPNKWFQNVEEVAAQEIGRETVQYVSNIYKYYVAYHMMLERRGETEAAKTEVGGKK